MASHNNDSREAVLHTSYPGHVYNFNPDTQTCEVQLSIDTLFTGVDSAYSFVPKKRLKNVPVQFIQGGGWSFTHPVPDGSPCWVHFAMRGIDHWLAENKSAPELVNGKPSPAYSRMFSHLNAVCTLGIQPIPKAIPMFQNDRMEMRNADRTMKVSLTNSVAEFNAGKTVLRMAKDGDIRAETTTKATIKAPQIMLDGAVTVTKSLTVQGGMSVTGALGGQTMEITGDIKQTGSYSINGVKVDGHNHRGNGAGNDTGPMK